MDLEETVRLCRVIASLKPAQHFDEDTPKFWAPVFEDTTLKDALEAVKQLARDTRFIDTSDVVKLAAVIRRSRAMSDADGLVPNVDPDDIAGYIVERRAITAAAGNGTLDAERYERGGFTLSGAAPWRPQRTWIPDDPERVLSITESVALAARVPTAADERTRNALEEAAAERLKAEAHAALAQWEDDHE
jgi:hypothetical protein